MTFLKKDLSEFCISLVFFFLDCSAVWGLAVVIPPSKQVVSFFHNLPTCLEKANATIDDFLDNRVSSDIKPQLDEITKELSANITSWAGSISGRSCQLGQQLDQVASQVVALINIPFIVFIFCEMEKDLKGHIVRFLPAKIRQIG